MGTTQENLQNKELTAEQVLTLARLKLTEKLVKDGKYIEFAEGTMKLALSANELGDNPAALEMQQQILEALRSNDLQNIAAGLTGNSQDYSIQASLSGISSRLSDRG